MTAWKMKLAHPTQIPLQDSPGESVVNDLEVKGKLPPWLSGTLIRNGPAKFHFGSQCISHWFDGLAMLHAFTFGDGKVSYRSRFLRSDPYKDCVEKGDVHFMGFAQDPCKSIFKRLFSYFLPSLTHTLVQNGNVNVMRIAEHHVAMTETPLPVRFDPHTLKTLGVLDFQDRLCKADCFESAHPHHDKLKEMTINYQTEFGRDCTYVIYTVPDKGPATRTPIFTMKTDKAAYMHTFALTQRFVVLVEFPLVLNPTDLLLKPGGFITHFHWEPQRNTRFHLIDRVHGSLVRTYETEAFFCFHHVNAYEENGTVVVDLVQYPDPTIVYGDPGPGLVRTFERYRLDENSPRIIKETLATTPLELPRIYYQEHNTLPYRYVYGVGFKYPEGKNASIPIIKMDVSMRSQTEWSLPGAWAGEPVFIPRPNATDEDDGILLTVVLDAQQESSYLLVLDARDLTEIARTGALKMIPYGLHGMFYHN